jgi:hypothetical protein
MSTEVTNLDDSLSTLTAWEGKLLGEEAAPRLKGIPVDYKFENLESPASVISFLYEIGDALVMGVARHAIGEHFQPFLVVTEKRKRSHGPGLGHRQDYRPRKCGNPNFAKAIENAITRQEQIEAAVALDGAAQEAKAAAEQVLAEDLGDTRIPDEILAWRRDDGLYQVHMPSVCITAKKLRALCQLLLGEEIPQLQG